MNVYGSPKMEAFDRWPKIYKQLLTILMFIDQKKLRARSKIALEEGMNKFAYFLLKLIKHFLF